MRYDFKFESYFSGVLGYPELPVLGVLRQAWRMDKLQSETERPANTRDIQLARGKGKNISIRNQGCLASSEPNPSTTASPGYPNTPMSTHLVMLIEDFKKDINNLLREIQENTGKQPEVLKEETQKSLKELQENTNR